MASDEQLPGCITPVMTEIVPRAYSARLKYQHQKSRGFTHLIKRAATLASTFGDRSVRRGARVWPGTLPATPRIRFTFPVMGCC